VYRAKKLISVPAPEGVLRTRLSDIERIRLTVQHDTLQLSVPVVTQGGATPWWRYKKMRETRILEGEAAVRAAGALLPLVNRSGGSAADVQRAVGIVEEAESPERLFASAARTLAARSGSGFGDTRRRTSLKRVPLATRLALEMAAHEETERRALEGELYLLEEAWQQAEEIAAIADDLFLPQSIDAELRRAVETQPRGVHTEVVVGEVAPVALPVALHVLLAMVVVLGHDARRVFAGDAEVRDGVARQRFGRRVAEHVHRVHA
jgi:hypothetical protein